MSSSPLLSASSSNSSLSSLSSLSSTSSTSPTTHQNIPSPNPNMSTPTPFTPSHPPPPTPKPRRTPRRRRPRKPFPFLLLPPELQRQILSYILTPPCTSPSSSAAPIDIHPPPPKLHSLLLTSRLLNSLTTSIFFSTNTFLLLPTSPLAVLPHVKPLLSYLQPAQRALIQRLELRLGTFWTDPPRCWRVDERLGLEGMGRVREVRVVAALDPAGLGVEGFGKRGGRGWYAGFCAGLVGEVVRRLEGGRVGKGGGDGSGEGRGGLRVVLEGCAGGVSPRGELMRRLREVVVGGGRKVVWGEEMAGEMRRLEEENRRREEEERREWGVGMIGRGLEMIDLDMGANAYDVPVAPPLIWPHA